MPRRWYRFPRTRGDVPGTIRPRSKSGQLPPHARGCTQRRRRRAQRRHASPARAGMYLPRLQGDKLPCRFPRTRGDVPPAAKAAAKPAALPPHARGCTAMRSATWTATRASPARAGMYPDAAARLRGVRRLPPHARGCTAPAIGNERSAWASPARAGMYPRSRPPFRPPACFPRTRGDVPAAQRAGVMSSSLPPHARGCTHHRRLQRRRPRASPARAGMYRCNATPSDAAAGFPRTRGDVPNS